MSGQVLLVVPEAVTFFCDGDPGTVDVPAIMAYVTEATGIPCSFHGSVYRTATETQRASAACEFSRARIKDPAKRSLSAEPLPGEIDYEARRLSNPHWKAFGVLYEGLSYQRIILSLMDRKQARMSRCPIVLTGQLVATWDADDRRYHARTSVYGLPHLISVTGLVQAPARPRAFYLQRHTGVPVESLATEFGNSFLQHGDERITRVLQGYVMQALFFALVGDPFFKDPDCRLFNSHWQHEVIRSQTMGGVRFCPEHRRVIDRIKAGHPGLAAPV